MRLDVVFFSRETRASELAGPAVLCTPLSGLANGAPGVTRLPALVSP